MYHSVLVPLDGSSFGEQALPVALRIADQAEIPLQVVHVHVPLAPVYADTMVGVESTLDPNRREREEAYLSGVKQRLAARSPVQVHSALIEGPAPEALREYAQSKGVDLVVMTTHGRGPLSRFWLGSIADQFVRATPIPTLLVRPQVEPPDFAKGQIPRHFLIALDGTPLAEEILVPVVALGRLMKADYTLIRVVEPLLFIGQGPIDYGPRLPDEQCLKEQRDEAQIYLDRIAGPMRGQGLQVRTRVAAANHVAAAILDEAYNQAMDLIALQTHGRRGLARLLLGSVADKVVRGSSLPVFLCRTRKERTVPSFRTN